MRLRERLQDATDRVMALADAFDALAARRFGFAERDDRAWMLVLLLLAGHVVVWTLVPLLSQNNLADSVDMVENWTWGREWQLGYWKHPPFFAWVTGAWFSLLPRADWAYYLLSAVNAAVGLAGTWALTGVVDVSARRRLLAVAGLALTPIWGFLAVKFNANAVLLAVWPWATWAFLRAMRTPTAVNGAVLGLLLAVAMLSKYVSVVLILGMIVTVLLDPRRRAILVSPAMIAAAVVGLVALAPHLWWMVATEFRTLAYAEKQQASSTAQFVNYLVRLPFSMVLFLAPMIAAVLVALPRADWRGLRAVFSWRRSDEGRRAVLGVGLFSFVAMAALGTWKWVKLSSQWGFPLMFPWGWLTTSTPGLDDRRFRLDRVALLVGLVWGTLLAAAPVIDVVTTLHGSKVAVEPRAELGREVSRIWREAAGTPLAFVAGTFDLASNVSFYAPEGPSMLIEFDRLKSPWATAERTRRDGIAVVCAHDDDACALSARTMLEADPTPREVTVAKRWFGIALKPLTVRLFLRLPERPA